MILVTGGAGFIGSHMVKMLRERGERILVLDNFSTGYRDALFGDQYVEGSIGDLELLNQLFCEQPIQAVINFASFIAVGESVKRPDLYYRNNVADTLVLLEAMVRHGIKQFIFSSSAAVYGHPDRVPITEDAVKNPVSPYGRSKWMIEQALDDFDVAFDLRSVSLRYFNAAGADPDALLGERHNPETHLIPLVLRVAKGEKSHLDIYGDDYPTVDGTCVRDYIHVLDLCRAHLLALDYLRRGGESRAYNLGNGQGFSVREVVAAAERVTGASVPCRVSPRRPGDPPVLVASSDRIYSELGWLPKFSELDRVIRDAWRFEQTRSDDRLD